MGSSSDDVLIEHITFAILRQGEQIIMVQQGSPHDDKRYWGLPGGLVEAGELVVDALVREVQEEAGVQITEIKHLACCSQVNRPANNSQVIAFIFEVKTWKGTLSVQDPDAEVLAVELVPFTEAIQRLEQNGGWSAFQEPLLAYLRGSAQVGTICFYREDTEGQHLVASVPN